MPLIDLFTSPPPPSPESAFTRAGFALFSRASTSFQTQNLMDEDAATLCDEPMSPLQIVDSWREQSLQKRDSLSKSESPGNRDSGFFEEDDDALIAFDRDLELQSDRFIKSDSAAGKPVEDKQKERYLHKQKFVFHDIEDRTFIGVAKHLPNNRVLVKGDNDDEEYTIAYDADEIEQAAENSWPDQSLVWRDKFTPRYSILRQKPRVVERYVPQYSRLAQKQLRWKKGIYRCYDAEEDVYDEPVESKHFTDIDKRIVTLGKADGAAMDTDTDMAKPKTVRLHAIEIANIAAGTLPEDVKVILRPSP